MGDTSQSRYSIIERLASKKLEIMDEKQKIEGDIAAKKIQASQMKLNMDQRKRDQEEQLNQEMENTKQRIAEIEQEIASLETGKTSKASLCDLKIAEIDKAMASIQSISAESAKEANS